MAFSSSRAVCAVLLGSWCIENASLKSSPAQHEDSWSDVSE